MGKQSSKVLKRKAQKIYDIDPTRYTTDFDGNKEAVKGLGLFDYSKTDRNIVAGIITRLVKAQAKEAQ